MNIKKTIQNPENMKIGFDAKRFFHNATGLGNYSRDLIRILSTYYPENKYFLYNTKVSDKYSIPQDHHSSTERLPVGIWKKLSGLWRLWGTKSFEKDQLDIFHGLSGEIPLFLPKNIKKVVTIHDMIFARYPHLYSFVDRKIHFWKFKKAAQKADVVIAISKQTKQDIITFLNIPETKIKVVYQGCAPAFKKYFSAAEKENVRAKYNLPAHFILNVGTLEERKNALNIVKAIRNIDTNLVLIGKKTNYYKKIESYIEEHQLREKVIHLSGIAQDELAMIYQLADVFVYPSVFEGFGIPIIEALYSRTPVVTTNSGVFPEAGGLDSQYVDPENPVEIAHAIRFFTENEANSRKAEENGWQFVQKFNDKHIADELITLYNEVLK